MKLEVCVQMQILEIAFTPINYNTKYVGQTFAMVLN